MSHDDQHGHDPHAAPVDGGHGGHGHDERLQAAPNPPPRGAEDSAHRVAPEPTSHTSAPPLRSADGILRPIQDSEYFSYDPASVAAVSSHIDEYFNQPLDLFPFWESEGKPDRFHVLFSRQIEERFPVDSDLRKHIHDYGRRVFRALMVHVSVKRVSQLLALIGFALLATLGPTWFASWTGSPPMG
ncbi:MAG: hypothetical protein EON86_15895, partial [Brevundimonas sp.]